MNNHSKRLCKHLESLDFRRDYDAEAKVKKGTRVYRHANEPETAIKVFDCMTDSTITTQMKNAARVIGLATTVTPKAKERIKVTRQSVKEQQRREREAREARADAKEAEVRLQQRIADHLRNRREIEELMRNGYGR